VTNTTAAEPNIQCYWYQSPHLDMNLRQFYPFSVVKNYFSKVDLNIILTSPQSSKLMFPHQNSVSIPCLLHLSHMSIQSCQCRTTGRTSFYIMTCSVFKVYGTVPNFELNNNNCSEFWNVRSHLTFLLSKQSPLFFDFTIFKVFQKWQGMLPAPSYPTSCWRYRCLCLKAGSSNDTAQKLWSSKSRAG
jgi:hypothetical protein